MIRFDHVTKRFGAKTVLDDVSYEIERGETFVIVGRSGAGKSVSLRHMIRLLTPEAGRVWVGEDCVSEADGKDLERILGRFGVLFQSAALLQWLNVEDNVCLPLRQKTNLSEKEIRARAAEKLDAKLKLEAHWLERGVTARRKRNQGRLEKLWQMRAQRASMIASAGMPSRAICCNAFAPSGAMTGS